MLIIERRLKEEILWFCAAFIIINWEINMQSDIITKDKTLVKCRATMTGQTHLNFEYLFATKFVIASVSEATQ